MFIFCLNDIREWQCKQFFEKEFRLSIEFFIKPSLAFFALHELEQKNFENPLFNLLLYSYKDLKNFLEHLLQFNSIVFIENNYCKRAIKVDFFIKNGILKRKSG